ncbi:MAG: hypothetical protein O2965_01985, partial [Bacteroidetes bacterium]|nr:hypothetical protein [Bacteroidota bacterium]
MKKITFLIVMLCFWMGHSQVAQRATPTLSQADSRVAAQTAPTQQTTSGNSSLSAVSKESSDQVQSLRENEALFADYLQNAQRSVQTNQISVDQIVQRPGLATIVLDAADRGISQGNPVILRQSTIDRLEQAPCTYANPSNAWENGYNYTGAFGAVENDFIVEAGVTFDFDQITYNTFIAPGETVVSVD